MMHNPDLSRMTKRELEVARLVSQGLTHEQAAVDLCISPSTIKNLLNKAYRKTGIPNIALMAYTIGFQDGANNGQTKPGA